MSTRDFKPSRRGFIKASLVGTAITSLTGTASGQEQVPALANYEPQVFSSVEWAFVLAATSRLIPSEGDGPGATEARVPVFIDLQLAGNFGEAADWYMEAPHAPDSDILMGFQSPMTPTQIYHEGIAAFNEWCQETKGEYFADLDRSSQDDALRALESGEVGLPDTLRDFFSLLLQNTKEGYFSDPRYGGNYGMSAWVHIGFPGARASFLEWNDPAMDNVAYPLGPVSIAGDRT